MQDLLLRVHVVVQNLNLEISHCHLVDCERIVLNCMPHMQRNYISSFNQSDHCLLVSWLPLLSSLLKLPNAAELRTVLLSLRKLQHFLISRHVSMLQTSSSVTKYW